MRTGLTSLLLAFWIALATQAPAAQASSQWCDSDPALLIQTPAGGVVLVYVTVGAQSAIYTPNTLISSIQPSYTAVPKSNGAATRVSVFVTVPASLLDPFFATRVIVSSGPYGTGTVYSRVQGVSSEQMASVFDLALP